MTQRPSELPRAKTPGALDIASGAVDSLVDLAQAEASSEGSVKPSLLGVCRAMASELQLEEVLDTILELIVDEMNAQQASILLFDEHQDQLQMLASIGLPDEITQKGYIQRKGSIAEWVIEHDEPLILNDRPKSDQMEFLNEARRINSSMCFPLRARGEILGTINLNRTDDNIYPFEPRDLESMDILASQAAICIQNSRLHESYLSQERFAAIGQTVAGVSHCIKNVLTGMQGGMSLTKIAREQKNWDIMGQSLDVLENSVKRISTLALDMLEYSKQREPEIEDVDLEMLLRDIVKVTEIQASAKGGEVTLDIDPEARIAQGDTHQFFRCLLNLVQNAIDAPGSEGRVSISVVKNDAQNFVKRLKKPASAVTIIRVTDQGTSLDEAIRGKIFEPFFSTKGSQGTGLGLAVTRKIIEEFGGHIEVSSPPGEPTTFAIYLPA